MRKFIFIGIIALIMGACTSTEKLSQNQTADEIVIDSSTHDLMINDTEFDLWYIQYEDPATFKDLEYYRNWNRTYVRDYNALAVDNTKGYDIQHLFININEINDLELQHKLFHYFQFLEKVRGLRLKSGFRTRLTTYNSRRR